MCCIPLLMFMLASRYQRQVVTYCFGDFALPMGGGSASRSEIMSGMSARAQFSAGFIHPVIRFDVDFKPTRM